MKMRILAALLAAVMLLSTSALAADGEAVVTSLDESGQTPTAVSETATDDIPAPVADEDDGIPTETPPTDTVVPSVTIAAPATVAYGANSEWFDAELAEANSLGLIPSRFEGADLRVPMSRAEFAAVALLLYQRMSSKAVDLPNNNPFTDTTDADVLRAYTAGIVNGTAKDTYSPNAQVSRQQTATMLTRVYKAVNWPDWTLAGDSTYSAHGLDYGGVALYADDGMIDEYAFPSVYFLTKYGVTNGTGNNCFSPDEGCTREQGIALALRLFKMFG